MGHYLILRPGRDIDLSRSGGHNFPSRRPGKNVGSLAAAPDLELDGLDSGKRNAIQLAIDDDADLLLMDERARVAPLPPFLGGGVGIIEPHSPIRVMIFAGRI